MRYVNSPNDSSQNPFGPHIIRMSNEEVMEKARSNRRNGATVVSNLTAKKLLFSDRTDVVLGRRIASFNDLRGIAQNLFYSSSATCYFKGVQDALLANPSLGCNTTFEQTYPTNLPYNGSQNKRLLACRVSEPFILECANGAVALAAFETINVAGCHFGGYHHIQPLIKREGVILVNETEKMTERAALFIKKQLPFTPREMDILYGLSLGLKSAEIADIYGISKYWVNDIRKALKRRAKSLGNDQNDVGIAINLKRMKIFTGI